MRRVQFASSEDGRARASSVTKWPRPLFRSRCIRKRAIRPDRCQWTSLCISSCASRRRVLSIALATSGGFAVQLDFAIGVPRAAPAQGHQRALEVRPRAAAVSSESESGGAWPRGLEDVACHIAKLESRGSRGFREILDVSSLRTRVGFGFFVTQLADSKPQTPRRGIGDSRDEPGFWMGLPRTMNPGGFVTSRKWRFIENKILKNWMKARVPRDDKPGVHLE